MANVCLLSWFWFVFVAASLLTSGFSLGEVPQLHRAGVFQLMEGGRYTLNFSAATASCLLRNVTIATRAQMERAVQQGLETCKYGWIQEKIAVIPRLHSEPNCGKGKTGLVLWFVKEDTKLGVFCFNASGLKEPPETSTIKAQTSTLSTTLTVPTQTLRLTTAPEESPSASQTSLTTDRAEQTSRTALPLHLSSTHGTTPQNPTTSEPGAAEKTSGTSAFTALVQTTQSARTTLPLHLTSTHGTTPQNPTTSEPGVIGVTVSPPGHKSNFSVIPRPMNSEPEGSMTALPTGLVVLGIVLLLLTAAAVWYHKRKICSLCQYEQMLDVESEMRKHTDGEIELNSPLGGKEEEEED